MNFCTPVVACATSLMLLASACAETSPGDNGTESADFATGGTFSKSIRQDPGDLDPHGSNSFTNYLVTDYAYDFLVRIAPDGTIVSNIATDWEVSPDSVRFTISDDVTCADGSALEPSDIKANYDFIKDPKNNSPLVDITPDGKFEVTADDKAGTVTITTPKPFGLLLPSVGQVEIVCPAGLEDRSLLERGTEGTGPFQITEAVPDDHYTLEARDDYTWGPDGATSDAPGFPDAVELRVIENITTSTNLLLGGDLTAAEAGEADRKRLEGRGFSEYEVPLWNLELFFNESSGRPGADPAVREALTRAINREEVAQVASSGFDKPAESLLSAKPAFCDDSEAADAIPSYDPEAAEQLLDDAGWKLGPGGIRSKGGQDLVLDGLGGEDEQAAGELVREAWEEIGVKVDFSFNNDVKENDILFGTGEWDVGPQIKFVTSSPYTVARVVAGEPPPDGINFGHVDNPEYNRLSAEALKKPGEEGCELWTEAARALYERSDAIPMVALTTGVYADKAQFELTPDGRIIAPSIRLLK